MALGVMFFVVAIAIIAVWIIIEAKRLKHKMLAIVLIALILFTYISFTAVLKGTNPDFKTVNGLTTAGKLYVSWLGTVFKNLKSVTAYASQQDWRGANKTNNNSPPPENQTVQEPLNSTITNQTISNSTNSTNLNETDPLQAIWDKL